MTQPPLAEGVRVAWHEMPANVRAAVEHVCGAPVRAAWTQRGGFSPGVAARVTCADGSRHFVKAASAEANPESPVMHRTEAAMLAGLRPLVEQGRVSAPRLTGVVDLPPWFAVVTEDVEGATPTLPWRDDELQAVLAALDQLAVALTPAPVHAPDVAGHLATTFNGWRTLAQCPPHDGLDQWSREHLDGLAGLEATWSAHAAGDTLLHLDVRADNLLLTASGVVFVDWPHACRGAAFLETVCFAPSVAMQGGPQPADLMAACRVGREVSREDLAPVVCALAGYFTERSLRPPPPGIPTVRAFQAAQAEVARHWLADLL